MMSSHASKRNQRTNPKRHPHDYCKNGSNLVHKRFMLLPALLVFCVVRCLPLLPQMSGQRFDSSLVFLSPLEQPSSSSSSSSSNDMRNMGPTPKPRPLSKNHAVDTHTKETPSLNQANANHHIPYNNLNNNPILQQQQGNWTIPHKANNLNTAALKEIRGRRYQQQHRRIRGIATRGKHVWAGWKELLAEKQKAFAEWSQLKEIDDDDGTRTTATARSRRTKTRTLQKPDPPDAPIQTITIHNSTDYNNDNSSKPILAIITSSRSMSLHKQPTNTPLWRFAITSLNQTVTKKEREQFQIHVYVAIDDNDAFWIKYCQHFRGLIPDWMHMTFGVFRKKVEKHIPFAEMAYYAYKNNITPPPEYFCRINDDSGFESTGWITTAVKALSDFDPPNVGVVGPSCKEGNWAILTHDFVHRKHLDIFEGWYYPQVFDNWYLDDWISFQYSGKVLGDNFHRTQQLPDFVVKHYSFRQRYVSSSRDAQYLPLEYERGLRLIRSYFKKHHSQWEQKLAKTLPMPVLQKHQSIQGAVGHVLKRNGNLLVWGLDHDSPYWFRSTSGRVHFLSDPKFANQNHPVQLLNPFLEFRDYVQRGNRAAPAENYVNLVKGQTLDKNSWCSSLKYPNFFEDLWDETLWDVILVSAPARLVNESHVDEKPGTGIFHSLFVTQQLVLHQFQMSLHNSSTGGEKQTYANPQFPRTVHVFVDHYNRPHEREFSNKVLGKLPHQVLYTAGQQDKDTSVLWEEGYAVAHFAIQESDVIVQKAESYLCEL